MKTVPISLNPCETENSRIESYAQATQIQIAFCGCGDGKDPHCFNLDNLQQLGIAKAKAWC
jgi:hypothetical protein